MYILMMPSNTARLLDGTTQLYTTKYVNTNQTKSCGVLCFTVYIAEHKNSKKASKLSTLILL